MTPRSSLVLIPAFALLVSVALAPRAEALPEALNVVASSLTEHYGVSGESVTALLDKGMSMESVLSKNVSTKKTIRVFGSLLIRGYRVFLLPRVVLRLME